MGKTTVENYVKDRIFNGLSNLEAFESKNLKDKEEFMALQQSTQLFKKDNPDESYKAIQSDLVRIQELHYWSFLLEQNMKNDLIKIRELILIADLTGIDLELDEDKAKAVEVIRSQDSELFQVNSSGMVSLVDSEFRPDLEKGINDRKSDPKNLETMYASIPVPTSM
jgi:hypothetical protein